MTINPNPKSAKNWINKSEQYKLEKMYHYPFSNYKYLKEFVWCIQNETFYFTLRFFSL